MNSVLQKIEKELLIKPKHPIFNVGDTVKVHFKIKEGDKERTQIFQGIVISKKKGSLNSTFTVRKISFGVGVERIFPYHSPRIAKIELVDRGKVTRSKLYYLRKRSGKAARIKKESLFTTETS